MKTKILLLFGLLLTGMHTVSYAVSDTITNKGSWFVPIELTVNPGDTIIFSLSTNHNVVEVTKSTWDANGNASNGGFSLDYGGGRLILNTPGIYYYVCTPHAVWGMKGTITVAGAVSLSEIQSGNTGQELELVYPNPFTDHLAFQFTLPSFSPVMMDIVDLTGKKVMTLTNQSYSAGTTVLETDLASLPSGPYLIRYKSGNESLIRNIVKR
jgi:plastocyanin